MGVVVSSWGEMRLKCLKELEPGLDMSVFVHPLIPRQCRFIEVEWHRGNSFFIRCSVILKELRNLENPSLKVITRKMWDIQFQEVFWVVVMWWMVGVYWRRRIGGGETFEGKGRLDAWQTLHNIMKLVGIGSGVFRTSSVNHWKGEKLSTKAPMM